ncbi:MAG: PAS domain-containing protein [Phycisphaerales bacterium]|nr:MAG: PAS domain-containing protein [Phycisphaerales bacterium]
MKLRRRMTSPGWIAAALVAGSAFAAFVGGWLGLPNAVRLLLPAGAAIALAWWALRGRAEAHERELSRLAERLEALTERLAGGAIGPPESADDVFSAAAAAVRRTEQAARVRTAAMESDLVELQAIFDGIAEPVLALGADGTVLLCNERAERMLGRTPDRLVGSLPEDLFTNRELVALCERAVAGERATRRLRLTMPGGNGVFEVTAEPTSAGDAVLTLRDVTELATAVQLRTDFVANASHELRTPLASIRAALETLRTWGDDTPAMREKLLDMIALNNTRLEAMVSDMLDLSRLESPDVQPTLSNVDLAQLAQTMREHFQQVCEDRELALVFEIEPEAETLRTDRHLLELILRNLIENATKFAYERTSVTVRAKVSGSRRGSADAVLEVADRGIGIPIEQQGRVFERYFQVNTSRTGPPERRGTGLGLAIVKHAARTLGGSVTIESVWKEGTTMRVRLPGAATKA